MNLHDGIVFSGYSGKNPHFHTELLTADGEQVLEFLFERRICVLIKYGQLALDRG